MVQPSPRRLTADQARRIALAAQGLTQPHASGAVDKRHFRRVFRTIGLLQLDSVNVVSRSHYLPMLARLGPYDRSKLDAYTLHPNEIFEYWGHEASLLPVDTYPLWRHRMDGITSWRRVQTLEAEHPGYVESVFDEIAMHGPMTVSDLADPGSRTGPWWGYGRGKIALEWLFAKGRIAAWRDRNFTRVYDLPERVIPHRILQKGALDREGAYRELLVEAARHHGVGTAADLGDYYRLHLPTVRPVLESLADAGRIERVDLPGWRGPVYAHPDATLARRTSVTALLSPFDSLVWNRDRTERLFGFRYRIEIYVPKEKRIHGYYVLPFLLDGRLRARVDLKADRKAGVMRVQGAFSDDGHDPLRIVAPLATTITTMSEWLGLGDVTVARRGDLAAGLRNAV
jgi:uncharacterized protein YcaQ